MNQIINQMGTYISTTKIEPTHFTVQYASPEVELICVFDDGKLTSGVKRQIALDASSGKYICYVDDDDEVSEYYIRCLLCAAESNADILTFKLTYSTEGALFKEYWTFGLYKNFRRAGLMCANHLCAWKRDIAVLVAWDPLLGYGDDRMWFEPLHHAGLIHTQYHTNEFLYRYKYDPKNTCNQKRQIVQEAKLYGGKGIKCFGDKHGDILIEIPSHAIYKHLPYHSCDDPTLVYVRDKNNTITKRAVNQLTHYHTVRI